MRLVLIGVNVATGVFTKHADDGLQLIFAELSKGKNPREIGTVSGCMTIVSVCRVGTIRRSSSFPFDAFPSGTERLNSFVGALRFGGKYRPNGFHRRLAYAVRFFFVDEMNVGRGINALASDLSLFVADFS